MSRDFKQQPYAASHAPNLTAAAGLEWELDNTDIQGHPDSTLPWPSPSPLEAAQVPLGYKVFQLSPGCPEVGGAHLQLQRDLPLPRNIKSRTLAPLAGPSISLPLGLLECQGPQSMAAAAYCSHLPEKEALFGLQSVSVPLQPQWSTELANPMKSQDLPRGNRSQRVSRRQREAQRRGREPLRTRKWEGPGERTDGKEERDKGAVESQG